MTMTCVLRVCCRSIHGPRVCSVGECRVIFIGCIIGEANFIRIICKSRLTAYIYNIVILQCLVKLTNFYYFYVYLVTRRL